MLGILYALLEGYEDNDVLTFWLLLYLQAATMTKYTMIRVAIMRLLCVARGLLAAARIPNGNQDLFPNMSL